MRPLTPVKYGCIGTAALLAYPFAVVAKDIGTLIVKYPRTMIIAAATAGLLAYTCADVQHSVGQLYRQGSSTVQQYRAHHKDEQRRLDSRIAAILMQNHALAKELQEERATNMRLATQAEYHALHQAAQARAPAAQEADPGSLRSAGAQEEVQANGEENVPVQVNAHVQANAQEIAQEYYFLVDVDDTLERIGKELTHDSRAARILASENGIIDDRKLLAGQLLRVPRALPARRHARLFTQRPALRSVILAGDTSITDLCGGNSQCAAEVLAVNRQMGLSYTDRFPYRRGARVVYFR